MKRLRFALLAIVTVLCLMSCISNKEVCDDDLENDLSWITDLDLDLTQYLPMPVTGATPVTSFIANKYNGWVSWMPGHGIFRNDNTYVATITLTALPGYSFPEGSIKVTHAHKSEDEVDTMTFHGNYDMREGTIKFAPAQVAQEEEGEGEEEAISSAGNLIRTVARQENRDFPELRIMALTPIEAVRLTNESDLGVNGLVLANNRSCIFDEIYNNSPENAIIDGGGLTVDLVDANTTNKSPLITVGRAVSLTLRNITLKRPANSDAAPGHIGGTDQNNNDAPLIAVRNGGNLTPEFRAKITENEAGRGGGVYVENGQPCGNDPNCHYAGQGNYNNVPDRQDRGSAVYVDYIQEQPRWCDQTLAEHLGTNVPGGQDGGSAVYVDYMQEQPRWCDQTLAEYLGTNDPDGKNRNKANN